MQIHMGLITSLHVSAHISFLSDYKIAHKMIKCVNILDIFERGGDMIPIQSSQFKADNIIYNGILESTFTYTWLRVYMA